MRTSLLLIAACAATSLFVGGEVKRIPLTQIRANPVALRSVDKDSEDYKELVGSIKSSGVLSSITVRKKIDPETKSEYYELIDGLHRYTASCDAGVDLAGNPITDIPAQILDESDARVLELQLMGNIHKIETKAAEYTNQLIRILKANPLMTEAELATKLGKSTAWISERLNLVNLCPEAQTLVNEGAIGLTNAYSLAKLPKDEQPNWIERAQTMAPGEFVVNAANRKKELDKAARAGKAPTEEKFNAHPALRKISILEEESKNLSNLTDLINRFAKGQPQAAAQLALQWALQLDPDSLAAREADFVAEKKRRDEDKAKRAAERKEQRAKEAQERSDKLKAEAATIKSNLQPA